MSNILSLIYPLLTMLPFILLIACSAKRNLKEPDRSRQCYMPLLAIVFCIVTGLLLGSLVDLIIGFLNNLGGWIRSFGAWLCSLFDGALLSVGSAVSKFGNTLTGAIATLDVPYWAELLVNAFIAILFLIFKRIALPILKLLCKDGAGHYERISGLVYRKQPEDGLRYIKPHLIQGVTLMKVLYYASAVFGVIATCATSFLLEKGLITSLYYPVFSVIMVGEVYFYLNGPVWDQEESSLSGEADRATKICDYTFLRRVLDRNFGDKLMSDNTSVNSDLLNFKTNDELLDELANSAQTSEEAYGLFMRRQVAAGLTLDQNYLASGLALLNGKSMIFNNPFYYDLIPYIFFPMNRTILRRKKVLIVLGRHAIEQDVEQWCDEGLTTVTHIPSLWKVGLLDREAKDLDVGIVTRSSVHDLAMHEAHADFFQDVEFVMLIEPSRLVATAQIGLNSLVRHCRRDGKKIVFCTTDKNCDGLVDALSHILMTSLEEVTATNKHRGTSSYMCWEADEEHLQHRMLPNLSRYLGVGTELSFTALKNQLSQVTWYGGEAFPVQDMHWIAKQYYFDLLRFASLPADQSTFDEVFKTSANMWNVRTQDNGYLTVEDENYNMYEAKRAFSTRTVNQGFVNVISTDYLLKDYMADNDGIFDADSKAIPYIVADYAHTARNVIYRLCLRLSTYPLAEADIRAELSLLNIDPGSDVTKSLWEVICTTTQSNGNVRYDEETGGALLTLSRGSTAYTFDASVIEAEKRYAFRAGKMETVYTIRNRTFIDVFLSDLCSAEYIAEDETDVNQFLGTELRGHIFQKYLPGQFFTFGGKYYEMVRLALDGRVIVRRAADHINGRPQYRQVRNYRIENVVDSSLMGDQRDIGGVRITKQYADIQVDTPAYWRMSRYNDFRTGKKITLNGVPTRKYFNKQLLRIDFSEQWSPEPKVLDTLALLMNEVFRTLYAENQCMIVAVTPGQAEAPLSYSLDGEGLQPNSLYIIEDSQLDLGFLVSVERNLPRILSILCDYLLWHSETLEESRTPPVKPAAASYVLTDEQRAEEEALEKEQKKQKGVRGFFRKIGSFFKNLFKRKPKKEKKKKKKDAPQEETPEIPTDQAVEAPEQTPVEAPQTDKTPVETPNVQDATDQPPQTERAPEEEPTMDQPKKEKKGFFKKLFGRKNKAAQPEAPAEEAAPAQEAVQEASAPEAAETPSAGQSPEEDAAEHPVLMSISAPRRLYSMVPVEAPEEVPQEAAQAPAEPEAAAPADPGEQPADAPAAGLQRKPYHQRYYLLFGGEEEPQTIDVNGTLDLLRRLGFGKGSLEQTRNGLSETENVEKNFLPDRKGSRYCDFCGTELFGSEYEILADGRERCTLCGRTAVKTEKEFKRIYETVIQNLAIFYGISINAPVKIQMVNAKTLHKKLGKSFIPTGKADGRVLGVAIRSKKDGYTILLENGSPRLSATMTMVHELTHIWQYLNWDAGKIKHLYGSRQNLEIYEGMAKWVEIQYAYLIGEKQTAKREELITRMREDPYGYGFVKYAEVYPLSTGTRLQGQTPFHNISQPL